MKRLLCAKISLPWLIYCAVMLDVVAVIALKLVSMVGSDSCSCSYRKHLSASFSPTLIKHYNVIGWLVKPWIYACKDT